MERTGTKAAPLNGKKALDLIVSCVQKHINSPHYRILCFGSRARQKASSRSDFDIAVEADGEIPLAVLAKIEADLDDLPILQKVDLVDLAAADPSFRAEALKGARLLYEQ